MSLMVPNWWFTNQLSTLDLGTMVAGNVPQNHTFTLGTTNVKGATSVIFTSLQASFDVHYFELTIGGIFTAAANIQALADLRTDPAGGTAWEDTIANIACGMTFQHTSGGSTPLKLGFPVYRKAGTSWGIRGQTNSATVNASNQARYTLTLYGNPCRPDMFVQGVGCETIGADTANSNGTQVTPATTATTPSYGSWTVIGKANRTSKAVQMSIGGPVTTVVASTSLQFQLGQGASSILQYVPPLMAMYDTSERGGRNNHDRAYACDVASGTTFIVRATGIGTVLPTGVCVHSVF